MQITDWNERWQKNQIGFHENQPNQYLVQYIKQFNLLSNSIVFVPLCGKSNDLKWLADQGYEVIGIECSSVAVEDFFKHHHLKASVKTVGKLTAYQCENITIYQGDFYDLDQSHLPQCDFIYDRASMVAFTKEQRPQYIKHLSQWFTKKTKMLLITLSYDQSIMAGPPFSVPNSDVDTFYQNKNISTLALNDVINEGPRWRKVGLKSLIETAFLIS